MKVLRILSLVVVVAMLLGGCAPTATTAPAGETAAPAAETAAPAGIECTMPALKLGIEYTFTGDGAAYGDAAKQGYEVAKAYLNEHGGINGQCVDYVYRDSKSDPKESAVIASEFCDNKDVNFILGDWASALSLSAAPLYDECNKLLISGSSSHGDLTKLHPNFWRSIIPNSDEAGWTAGYYLDQLKPANVAIVYQENDWGLDIRKYFMEQVQKRNIPVVADLPYLGDLKDFKALTTQLQVVAPDVVLMASYYTDGAMFISQAMEMGFTPKWVSITSFPRQEFIDIAGAASEGVMASSSFWPYDTRSGVQRYVEAYKAMYDGKIPTDDVGAYCFDSVLMLADAASRAGTLDVAAVSKALGETKDLDGATGVITIGADREPHHALVPVIVKDGKWTLYEAAAAAPAASACTQPALKIGVQMTFTGDMANYGVDSKTGYEPARAWINTHGGVLGRCVEYVYRDSKGDPKESAALASEFCDNKDINFVIGDFTSAQSLSAGPLYDECKKILISSTSSSTDLTKLHRYFWRSIIPNSDEVIWTANYWIGLYKPAKVAIVYNDNDWGLDVSSLYKQVVEDNGLSLVANVAYLPDLKDFKAIVTQLQEVAPDMVLMGSYYTDGGMLVSQAAEMAFTPKWVGITSLPLDTFISVAGKASEGVVASTAFAPDNPRSGVQKYVEAYKAMYDGKIPTNTIAAYGWDAAMMLFEAINRAGTADDVEAVWNALATTKNYDGATGDITIGADREPHHDLVPVIVKDGKWTLYTGQ